MTKNRILNFILFVMTLTSFSISVKSQILKNSDFRIYRAEFILGTVTQLRLNPDSTYEMNIIEINCSLCDHNELYNSINATGKWTQTNDTISLDSKKKLLVLYDKIIRPLYGIGVNTDTILTEKTQKNIDRIIASGLNDFHLVYDTYPNGIVRQVLDKYRMRMSEYDIEFDDNGLVKDVKYYWDKRRRKKLK
jgi:hypothetical protein